MRILHTADWHLGHSLHEVPRDPEHAAFLAWLLDTLEVREVDALLLAGDVFEVANPPTPALEAWYGFLAELARRLPALDVVVIGGNHDSAARLDAPRPLLAGGKVRVVGGLPRSGRELELERLVLPLHDGAGEVAAWVAAVPYLRAADLPPRGDDEEPGLVAGVRAVYDEVLVEARRRRQPGQALVGMGHLYMTGGELSELSERRIQAGNLHALPADLFPEDLAYVALGHLHKAQRVAGREGLRYAGSPIPLSMAEAPYRHQVLLVELEGEDLAGVEALPVPRSVELLRLGPAPLAELEEELAGLPEAGEGPRPFLEVRVRLKEPRPDLRRRLEEAVEGKQARLVKITPEYPGEGGALADRDPAESLESLRPEEVFRRRWARDHEGDPPPRMLEAFGELVEAAQAED